MYRLFLGAADGTVHQSEAGHGLVTEEGVDSLDQLRLQVHQLGGQGGAVDPEVKGAVDPFRPVMGNAVRLGVAGEVLADDGLPVGDHAGARETAAAEDGFGQLLHRLADGADAAMSFDGHEKRAAFFEIAEARRVGTNQRRGNRLDR